MKVGHPITDLAQAIVHAQLQGLPSIKLQRPHRPPGMTMDEYKAQVSARILPTVTEETRPLPENFDVFMFPQIWPSTALGFGGMGGASIRQANTVVVACRRCRAAAVYFAGQHAYTVDLADAAVRQRLDDDIRERRVASRAEAAERYRPTLQAAPVPDGMGA